MTMMVKAITKGVNCARINALRTHTHSKSKHTYSKDDVELITFDLSFTRPLNIITYTKIY